MRGVCKSFNTGGNCLLIKRYLGDVVLPSPGRLVKCSAGMLECGGMFMLTRLLKLLGSLTLAVGVERFRRGISQGRIQRSSASRQVAPDHASRVA